ncbi:MAG: hypothetical protein PWP03_557 [Candidatus Woesearchaeota archaeon]|nr:hypothetical protein [Candidatus Woesearchaeota archaeon]
MNYQKHIKKDVLITLVTITFIILLTKQTFALPVAYIEIENDTLKLHKPYDLGILPKENKIPYYKIIIDDKYSILSNDLSFFIPIIKEDFNLKVIYLVNNSLIYNFRVSYCNNNNVCEPYELDSCTDCMILSPQEIADKLKSDYKKATENLEKFEIKSNKLEILVAIILSIIFIISLMFLPRKRKRGNLSLSGIVIALIGVITATTIIMIFSANARTFQEKTRDLTDRFELINLCQKLNKEYYNYDIEYLILFYGLENAQCSLRYKEKEWVCNGLCKGTMINGIRKKDELGQPTEGSSISINIQY